jgi:hypothetical protein
MSVPCGKRNLNFAERRRDLSNMLALILAQSWIARKKTITDDTETLAVNLF